jgi:hypothetical protein
MKRKKNMKTIHKYQLNITDFQEIEMPEGAKILHVESQPTPHMLSKERLCLWAEVDDEKPLVPRRIRVFGTGHDMEHEHQLRYIGTTPMHNHALVWHVYENFILKSYDSRSTNESTSE